MSESTVAVRTMRGDEASIEGGVMVFGEGFECQASLSRLYGVDLQLSNCCSEPLGILQAFCK